MNQMLNAESEVLVIFVNLSDLSTRSHYLASLYCIVVDPMGFRNFDYNLENKNVQELADSFFLYFYFAKLFTFQHASCL